MAEMITGHIDYDAALAAPRYAGGHEEVMRCLFRGADVLAEYIEDDYQGQEAFAYRLSDGRIALVNDYFGSCSGCDSWEDATNEEARQMITTLATNAHIEPDVPSALAWLRGEAQADAAHYDWRGVAGVLADRLEAAHV